MAPLSEAEQLTTLLELQRDLALEANVDKVLLRITLAATHMLDADRATLYVVDQAKNLIWSRVLTEGGERGESVAQIREIRLPLDGRGLATEVARNGHLLRIDDPYDDPRFDPSVDARTGYRTRSILVVPIDSRDRRRLGVLQAVNHADGPFRSDDERYAVSLATSAGIALEYVQLFGDLAGERLRVVKAAGAGRRRGPVRSGPAIRARGGCGRVHSDPRGCEQRDHDGPRGRGVDRRVRGRRRGRSDGRRQREGIRCGEHRSRAMRHAVAS